VATTCSERNIQLVKSLGAEHTIDYRTQDVGLTLQPLHIDAVYDTVGGFDIWEKSFKYILSPSGKFATIAGDKQYPISPVSVVTFGASQVNRSFWNAFGYYPSYSLVLVKPNSEQLDKITKIIEEGGIKAVIDKRFPLESSIDAFKYLMTGRATGKIVIDVFNSTEI